MTDTNIKKTINKINIQKNIDFYKNINKNKDTKSLPLEKQTKEEKKEKISPEALYQFSSVLKHNQLK